MAPRISRIPFADNLLRRLAEDLLTSLPGADSGDFTGGLVLLPSSRACLTLQHELLEQSGLNTLLLPRIVTVTQWADEMAAALGLTVADLPDDRVRSLILARRLMTLPWLQDNKESAPGLAAEFIGFFDEVRLNRRDDLILDPANRDRVVEKSPDAEAEIIEGDLRRIHEVWDIYRRLVPRDSVDRLQDEAAALAVSGVPGPAPHLVVVAGFGRVDPVRAELLRAALDHGAEGRVYLPEVKGQLSRFFQATWSPDALGTDPLAPARRTEFLLTGESPESVLNEEATTLKGRLGELAKGGLPDSLPVFIPCGDAEAESRLAAHRVAEILAAAGEENPGIAVCVGDPRLAARITAQLRDAGIDVDNTHGQALSSLPAGMLVRFILRAALTDLRPEPLLEVLTHPYVKLPVADGTHGAWTLRLERMYRRNQGPPGGLAGLRRQAADRDQSARNLFHKQGPGMVEFVKAVTEAFAPLLEIRNARTADWSSLVTAVRGAWISLAPDYPLGEKKDRPDVTAIHRLLEMLSADAGLLPPVDLADFTGDLGQLMAAENVPAHRARNLPVLVTGLVEARLESYDHLIVAGLRDGIFPSRPQRLFLRLLHNAPDVLLTWTTEEEGQPVLPSPFVSRLRLVLQPDEVQETPTTLWRRQEVPWHDIETSAESFRTEDPHPTALAKIRPLTHLSWTGLRRWRDCPYRFLLERGFALRKEEEVQEEFGRLEYGRLVHEALADFLAPDGPGYEALAKGDREKAEELMARAAKDKFAPGADDLPLRHLWLSSFLRAVPPVVSHELKRFEEWRPVALEEGFEMPLTDLADWTAREAKSFDWDPGLPPMTGHAADIVLRGTIDRIDRRQDGTGALSVIDYKTGSAPSAKKVKELEVAVKAGDPAGNFPLIPREIRGEGEASLPCDFCEFRGACRLEERDLPPGTDRKLDKLVNSQDMF
jgi:ATP-dependent helicase/nuclease subunit B